MEQGRAASSEAPPAADGGYTVLITGSTKGIGRALAEEFLSRGDRVVITSRDASRVAETVRELAAAHGAGRVAGLACNVSKGSDVTALADFATQRFGQVDIWVNNAGNPCHSTTSHESNRTTDRIILHPSRVDSERVVVEPDGASSDQALWCICSALATK